MCRKHCRSAGGCICDGHFIATEMSLSHPVAAPSLPQGLSLQHLSSTQSDVLAPSSSIGSLLTDPVEASPCTFRKSPSLSQIDPVLLSDSIHPSPSPSSSPPTSLVSQSEPSTSRLETTTSDCLANPHYMSHLRPLLAEHVATTHQCAELKRRKDSEQAQHRKQAMEYIVAFSFVQVSGRVCSGLYALSDHMLGIDMCRMTWSPCS
jgi:hypothetical protein